MVGHDYTTWGLRKAASWPMKAFIACRLGVRVSNTWPKYGETEGHVNELARYLMENAYIDFQGGITIDEVRKFLRDEDSRESRALLSRLIEDRGLDDLMVTIADCLKEYIRTGINEDIVRAQLTSYSES
jgi:hypothetical protein